MGNNVNRCRRCHRELSDPKALYGWRCAEILGVSESLDEANDATWTEFLQYYSEANEYLKQHSIDVSSIYSTDFYDAYIKKQIAASMGIEDAVRALEQVIYDILTCKLDYLFPSNIENDGDNINLNDIIKLKDNYWETLSYFEDITFIKSQISKIMKQSKKVMPYSIAPWDTYDAIAWETIYLATGRHDYIIDYKNNFITAYRQVIKSAAETYNIPPEMLAGVALCEVAGDPMWIDDAAYTWRVLWHDLFEKQVKDPNKTSFGYLSMQVRVAAETIRYDPDKLDLYKSGLISSALKDINLNIYISAKHLSDLKKIDYANKDSAKLTDEEIAAIAGRYNIGRSASLEDAQNSDYAKRILENMDNLRKLLNP